MDIDNGYCRLLFLWSVDNQSVISTRADLWARNCQALLRDKMNAGGEIISTFSTELRGRFFNHDYSDPPDKEHTIAQYCPSVIQINYLHPSDTLWKYLFAC